MIFGCVNQAGEDHRNVARMASQGIAAGEISLAATRAAGLQDPRARR